MNILITGATGFVASQIVTDLIAAGHSVTCCVRNISLAKNVFPNAKIIKCDFIKDNKIDTWIKRLINIDIVVNCAGILYHPNKKIIWDVHYNTPKALFDASVKVAVKKIIQISALNVDKSDLDYARSKKAADDYLSSLPIASVIVRPSLVYGHGSYGGTSLFRGLAALPGVIPLTGNGTQSFQPIHLNDLSKGIVHLIEIPIDQTIILNAVGPQQIILSDILKNIRSWLGFTKAKLLAIPLWLIKGLCKLGDRIPYSSINSTSYQMLLMNNVTTAEETKKFRDYIGFNPANFTSGLYSQPSTVQDRWHAKLFFIKPLLQLSIAFIWIFTAICSLFLYPKTASYSLLANIGINQEWQPLFFYGAITLDFVLGIAMFSAYQLRKICILQMIVIVFYSVIIAWKLPYLWFEPFAPMAKNIPLLVAILVLLVLESDR